MRALSEAILEDIRTAVAPVDVQPYRPEQIEMPFVWVREPSTNIGPPNLRMYDISKGGLLYIDIFANAWASEDGYVGVDEIEGQLAWLESHVVLSYGDARVIRYQKESAIPVYEEDSSHLSLTYSVQFADMRVA